MRDTLMDESRAPSVRPAAVKVWPMIVVLVFLLPCARAGLHRLRDLRWKLNAGEVLKYLKLAEDCDERQADGPRT